MYAGLHTFTGIYPTFPNTAHSGTRLILDYEQVHEYRSGRPPRLRLHVREPAHCSGSHTERRTCILVPYLYFIIYLRSISFATQQVLS